MFKRLTILAALMLAPVAAFAQQPLQWKYSFNSQDVNVATYPGTVSLTNSIPTYERVYGEGADEATSLYVGPTQTLARQSAIIAQIQAAAVTLPDPAQAAVGGKFAAQSGAGNNPIWGMASVAQWSATHPDISVQAAEFDINNNNSGTYTVPKLGVSIVSGGTYTGGWGLYVNSTSSANAFLIPLYVNGWNTNGAGLYIKRGTDSGPTGFFYQFRNAADTLNLAYVDKDGNNLAQSMQVSGAAGTTRPFILSTSGSIRWQIAANSTNETGSNAGSNLDISRYSDTGVLLGTSIQINRANGQTFIYTLVTPPTTVANLPAGPTAGQRAAVTDAVACTFGSGITGGGVNFCPIIYNGAAWQAG